MTPVALTAELVESFSGVFLSPMYDNPQPTPDPTPQPVAQVWLVVVEETAAEEDEDVVDVERVHDGVRVLLRRRHRAADRRDVRVVPRVVVLRYK